MFRNKWSKGMKKELVILLGWASQTLIIEKLLDTLSNDFNVTVVQYNDIKNENDILLISQDAISDKQNIRLVGWSLGGLTALKLAHIYENIHSATIIGGFSTFINSDKYKHGIRREYVESMIEGLKVEPKNILKKFYKNMGIDTTSQMYTHLLNSTEDMNIHSLILGLEFLLHEDISEILTGINIEVNLLHCRDDRIVSIKSAEYLKSKIKQANMFILDEGGHAPFSKHNKYIRDTIK